MSQAEIIACLEKTKVPMSRTEISIATGIPPNNVSAKLNRLLKFKEICIKHLDRFEATERFGVKHRMCLYYVEF